MRLLEWGVQLWHDFLDLLYPRCCAVCHRALLRDEDHLCLHCLQGLPRTHYHLLDSNLMEQLFYGKLDVERAVAWCYFAQGSDYRKLIHHIKYHNDPQCAYYLGWVYGKELQESALFLGVDYVVPVPLHPYRAWQRGYNQSERIAQGVADALGVSVANGWMKRVKHSQTQTNKSLYERWLNTQSIFALVDGHPFDHKRLILVDDVVTTGATLLACAKSLSRVKEVKISLLALAIAE